MGGTFVIIVIDDDDDDVDGTPPMPLDNPNEDVDADVANMVFGNFCTPPPAPSKPDALVVRNSRCGFAAASILSARLP